MSFFNFTPATDTEVARWSMAAEFYLYWVVAIPVTAVMVIFWLVWNRRFTAKFGDVNKSVDSEAERERTEMKKVSTESV